MDLTPVADLDYDNHGVGVADLVDDPVVALF
jgi:hypothetical protein